MLFAYFSSEANANNIQMETEVWLCYIRHGSLVAQMFVESMIRAENLLDSRRLHSLDHAELDRQPATPESRREINGKRLIRNPDKIFVDLLIYE